MKRLTYPAALGCALALWALPAGAAAPEPLAIKPEQARALQLQLAAPLPASQGDSLRLQGQVQLPPRSLRVLSAPVEALVEQVNVGVGDTVAAQRTLLVLNSQALVGWQLEYRQAQLQAEQAQRVAQRDAGLLSEGLIPAARAEASRHQQEAAQASLAERRRMLQLAGVAPDAALSGRAVVVAPAAGQVTELWAQPGQRVAAGTPLLSLALPGPLWLVLQASVEQAARVRIGDAVQVDGCAVPARIEALNGQLDGASQTRVLRAVWSRPPGCVLPQQRVQASLGLQGQPGGWWLPGAAVLRQEGHEVVYQQRPEGYVAVPVQRLATGADGRVQVRPLTGTWSAQDRLVVQGAVALKGLAAGLVNEGGQ